MRPFLRATSAVLCLLLLLLPWAGGPAAADQSYTINGVTVRYRDVSSAHDECWSYVAKFYQKIWGQALNSNFFAEENILRDLPAEELTLTPEHLKAYVLQAKPGAVIRVCNRSYLYGDDGMGHSLLIVSVDSTGLTTFEGGLNASPHCREHYYTWEEFCRTSWLGGRYAYIKYIKYPVIEIPDKYENRFTLELPVRPVGPGDVDGDGRLTAADCELLKAYVLGECSLPEELQPYADLDGDGVAGVSDYVLLKRRLQE